MGVFIVIFGMTLREGNREYFYDHLERLFPGLKEKYIRQFGNAYQVVSPNNNELMKIAYDVCKKNEILLGTDEVFQYLHEYEGENGYDQMRLF